MRNLEARIYDPAELDQIISFWVGRTQDEKKKERVRSLTRLLKKGYTIRVSLEKDEIVFTVEHDLFEKELRLPLSSYGRDWD